MKTRQAIGATIAIVGLFIAVCTKDGSSHELACRFFGTALFATGAFIGRFFDGMDDKPEPAVECDDDNGFSDSQRAAAYQPLPQTESRTLKIKINEKSSKNENTEQHHK